MAAATIPSDFGAQENKVCHCFHCFPICLPWSDITRCHDLVFWMLSFNLAFSPSSFTCVKLLIYSERWWWSFFSPEHLRSLLGVSRVINFNIVESRGVGKPEEREQEGRTASWWSISETQHSSSKFPILYGHGFWHPKTSYVVTSKIVVHTRTNLIVMMKKFEIVPELPKCDAETQSEQMLLEKWHQ